MVVGSFQRSSIGSNYRRNNYHGVRCAYGWRVTMASARSLRSRKIFDFELSRRDRFAKWRRFAATRKESKAADPRKLLATRTSGEQFTCLIATINEFAGFRFRGRHERVYDRTRRLSRLRAASVFLPRHRARFLVPSGRLAPLLISDDLPRLVYSSRLVFVGLAIVCALFGLPTCV